MCLANEIALFPVFLQVPTTIEILSGAVAGRSQSVMDGFDTR